MSSITRYRVWPDGDVQEADTPVHHWKSDDYELVEALNTEDAWARAKANAPAVPQGYEIHEIPADYSGLVWLEGQVRAVARLAQAATGPQGWTDADSDAARLALELECLLMDTKDLSVVSKWWASANDALELHRQRLAATPAPAPAVPQGEPVAWMVYGNYTRQPFGMLSSAEAYMRGLLKSDPDGGYHIRPLRYATPAAPEQTVPSVVWIVSNKTSSTVFATEEFAQKFISSFSGSVAGGFSVSRVDVIGARQPATDAGVMAQGVGLTDEEIEATAKKHMSTVGDHWSNEEAIREIHAEDFARDIIAALRAKESK